jgi:hypothetical protein
MKNKNMNEILDYLSARKDYAIFAGFAAQLHTGIKASEDIDIFVPSTKVVKKITNDFLSKGWKQTRLRTDKKVFMVSTVKKQGVAFDIIFAKLAKDSFLPSKTKIKVGNRMVYVLSTEALMVTKILQLISLKRTESKAKRDRKAIAILKKKVNKRKLKTLLKNMNPELWTESHY